MQVPQVHEVIHLGHKLSEDIYKFSSAKCGEDFNRQSNIFHANVKHANSNIRNALFHNYCTSFYSSQLLPFLAIIWRTSIQHGQLLCIESGGFHGDNSMNNMLPYLAGMIAPELWFAKRCIKFISMCMKSDNNIVKTISMMGVNRLYSVLGANYIVLSTKYGMNLNNIMKIWNERCANEEEIIRKCEQGRELCEVRDSCVTSILNKEESYTIIELLCTY